MKARDYQLQIAEKGYAILQSKKILYVAMQVRTGKTVTSLLIAEKYRAKNVLFLTKKRAITSIQSDYRAFGFDFSLTVINDESLHLIKNTFDLIIHDEHHRFGAYPKPGQTAKLFKEKFSHLPMIFLSGTPTPESYSQWFHQFWVSNYSPFKEYKNFYKWATDYVTVTQRHLGYATVNDYSNANEEKIKRVLQGYIITYTQQQAGFVSEVSETVLECEMKPITYSIIDKLKKDLVVESKNGNVILADTGAKLMQKIHQLSSGTCLFEDGTSKVIDFSKVEFIYEKFKDHKIAIFYKFKEEFNALSGFLGEKLTDNLEDFKSNPDNWIALQIVTGREGISLKEADCLVYYNIDFSAISYWQSRDRLSTIDRKSNEVFYVFSKNGIEHKIYNAVLAKKNYTLSIFNKDYERTRHTNQNKEQASIRWVGGC